MSKYDFTAIEAKWQRYWAEHDTFHAEDDYTKPKFYALVEFPYPSGQGLHIGHPRPYTAMDVVSRKRRMEGYNVLFPMGWDAFGLPTENYAIKHKIHPAIVTANNVARFKSQLQALGMSFDWDREINTTDPNYFHWTQWIFLQMFKKGLAYKKETAVNWCTSCKVVLANEEVVGGVCERCGGEVVQKVKSQWMLKITEYAQRLLDDLDEVDYLEKIKTAQRNWIGRSTGAEVDFQTTAGDTLKIYTTRPDTLFGATYMVVSPEHKIIPEITTAEQSDAVKAYQEAAAKKSDLERTDLAKDKTGVFSGSYAINPVNGKLIPIWIADYVLISYGTGAIMAVPAHDTRDWDFAKKFNLPIIEVLKSEVDVQKQAWTEDGVHVNSEFLNGLNKQDAIAKMLDFLEEKKIGRKAINYKLRDWVYSRQRYWGEPIPLIHCPKCGTVPVPEDQLPLTLPEVKSYQPTGTGESPLAAIDSWVNCKCPQCGSDAKRETNTMPQWGGSCWYYLRYLDPKNDKAFCSPEAEKYWMPVNLYIGGAEHAVLHLLYARFWHKVLYDIGVVSTKEPFQRLVNQGMITSFAFQRKNKTLVPTDEVEQTADGKFIEKKTGEELEQIVAKMSKSLKNVVNPDDEIKAYGADSVRMYEMFMGPLTMSKPWSTQGIVGIHRFLEKVWAVSEKPMADIDITGHLTDKTLVSARKTFAQTVTKVTNDTATLNFNTAISQMMIFINEVSKLPEVPKAMWSDFVKLLAPYAPHLGEELWQKLGHDKTISYESWPTISADFAKDDVKTIVVMVNGKKRDTFEAEPGQSDEALKEAAFTRDGVKKFTDGHEIVKCIVVKDKLVNIVVK